MARPPRRPEALANTIFRGAEAVRRQLLTPSALRSSAWTALFRGIYVASDVELTHRLRCLATSVHLLPEGAAIAGRSAAHLYGVPYVDALDPVELLTPRAFGPVQGLRIHRGAPEAGDIRQRERITVTSPQRTCLDLTRWLDLVDAVVFLDWMVAHRLVSVDSLASYASERTEGKRLTKACALVDPAAESPQESRVRVKLALAGFPMPVSQFVINDSRGFLARVDLAWPALKIAIEYDGAWHADRAQLERDRRRLNRLVSAGWIVLHVTAQRMRDDFPGIVGELRAAMIKRQG